MKTISKIFISIGIGILISGIVSIFAGLNKYLITTIAILTPLVIFPFFNEKRNVKKTEY